jgi:hypothetical protein
MKINAGDTMTIVPLEKNKPFTMHLVNPNTGGCESYAFQPDAMPLLITTNAPTKTTKKHWWSKV